jgi:hypothetical protein
MFLSGCFGRATYAPSWVNHSAVTCCSCVKEPTPAAALPMPITRFVLLYPGPDDPELPGQPAQGPALLPELAHS